MLISSVFILIGFVCLYYGAESLLLGAERIAVNLNIPQAIVGVILVAFGTSAPELIVNILSAYKGQVSFALSNISGSNLTNLCVGFGAIGLLFPIVFSTKELKEFKVDLIYFISAPILLITVILICNLQFLPLWSAFVFIPIVCYYFFIAIKRFKKGNNQNKFDRSDFIKGILFFILGILVLYIGGEFVLTNCMSIGENYNIDSSILGLTVVAMGTSIPDVMASVVAAKKKKHQIAVGNLIGSNIFNIYIVLSSTLIVSQSNLVISKVIFVDYIVVLILSTLFIVLLSLRKRIDLLLSLCLLLPFFTYYFFRIINSI